MTDTYVVLENIPNTPEGRAFLKQLRKYLRPEYKMRSRGRHSDRKGLAKKLVQHSRYEHLSMTDEDKERYIHTLLRESVSCKYAERITTVVKEDVPFGIYKRNGGWFYIPFGKTREAEQGPFKKYEAALAAKRVTEGT